MKSWILALVLSCLGQHGASAEYEANWESLDSRPLPPWYDQAKIGIFIHWGVFSVPSFGSEWFWQAWQDSHNPIYVNFMKDNYRPGFTYQDFGPMLTTEFFNPEQWATTFEAAGAQYIVLTSKHHEGFTNWPSKQSWGWNAMDLGPNRDLVGELADAIRKKTPHIHFGLYHSMFEWFNPFYIADKANNYQTNDFVERKTFPELLDIVNTYKPDVIYSDGEWEAPDWYWNSTLFLAWLFNDSPVKDTIVVNDRWGADTRGKHGSYYTHDDKFNPGVVQDHKWEGGLTLDKYSWGYRRNAVFADFLTPHEVITRLVTVVSCGGNFLVNIGPTHDGMLPPLMEERLRQMGEWLALNGEAIYSSTPWTVQNDTLTPGVWFTNVGDTVYGMVLLWPESGSVTLASVESTADTVVTMLGDSTGQPLETQQGEKGLEVTFPSQAAVISQWVWVLKMTGVNPAQRRHLKTRIPY